MTFKLKNKKIFNCLFLALLIGCSEKNPTASVGESILVVAELPEESQDLEFLWEFIDLPSNSLLENINLRIGNDNSSVIFTPDAPGIYSLNVSIFQYNDEVSSQNFTYEILTGDSNNFSINKFEKEEFITNVDSSISDSIKAIHNDKWYETDLATKLIDEIKSQEMKTEKESNQEINSKKTADNEPSSAKTKDIIKSKRKSTAKKSNKKKAGMSIPFDKERFTIQVASKKRLEDAKEIASRLIDNGYDAYIQKAFFRENNQTWYRIRVGSYKDKNMAQKVAMTISSEQREKAWVDHVRIEN